MTALPYWDQGRQRRRASDRLQTDNDGNPRRVTPLKQLPTDHLDFPHGDTGWQYGCRCAICVPAHRQRMAEYKRKVGLTRAGPYIPQEDRAARCGTRSGYIAHRRRGEDACPECRAANSKYQVAYVQGLRMIDPAIEAAMRDGM